MLAALAIDCPTAALVPVSGTSSATRFCCVCGSGASTGFSGGATIGGAVLTTRLGRRRTGREHGNGRQRGGALDLPGAAQSFQDTHMVKLPAVSGTSVPAAAQPPGLYIVATPIGNLGDLSPRAAQVLAGVALIAAEDTRVTARLLAHIGAKTPMTPYHDHNADAVRPRLVARAGSEAVALVSDAGTPLISDPGYKLVRDARAAGVNVVTIPGPCAAVAALTLAGLPTDRFLFAGFLPVKQGAKATAIAEIASVRASLVFYESAGRTAVTLTALCDGLGDRPAAVAREISKKFEETVDGRLSGLAAHYAEATAAR